MMNGLRLKVAGEGEIAGYLLEIFGIQVDLCGSVTSGPDGMRVSSDQQ